MTNFTKDQFNNDSGYVTYELSETERRKFVARFKYARGGAAGFISFLIKHFTVEEYFGRLDAGEAPLKILESKGFLLPHIKTLLKRHGYEVSAAGFDKYIQDGINARKASYAVNA